MNSGIKITRLSGYVRSPSRNQPYGWPMKKLWEKKRARPFRLWPISLCAPLILWIWQLKPEKTTRNIQAKFTRFWEN
jgi:hypothetical protein